MSTKVSHGDWEISVGNWEPIPFDFARLNEANEVFRKESSEASSALLGLLAGIPTSKDPRDIAESLGQSRRECLILLLMETLDILNEASQDD